MADLNSIQFDTGENTYGEDSATGSNPEGPVQGGIIRPEGIDNGEHSDQFRQSSENNFIPNPQDSFKQGTPLPEQLSDSAVSQFSSVEDLANAYLQQTTPPEQYSWNPPVHVDVDPVQDQAFQDLSKRIGLSQDQYNEIQNYALGIFNNSGGPQNEQGQQPQFQPDPYQQDQYQHEQQYQQQQPQMNDQMLQQQQNMQYQQQQQEQQYQQDQRESYHAQQVLQAAWGDDLERNLELAQVGVTQVYGPEGVQIAEQQGMGNDPEFIKRMAALGERATQEHYLHGQEQQQATTQSIRGEINKLMNGGRNSAYHDPMHADHNNAVNYVRQLYEKLY